MPFLLDHHQIYLNIFKIIRNPLLHDFIDFFINFKEKFNSQSNDTKIDINEYINNIENVSQEILVTMVFDIKTNNEEIEKKANDIIKILKVDDIDQYIKNIRDKIN